MASATWSDTLSEALRASVLATCGASSLTVKDFVVKANAENDMKGHVLTPSTIKSILDKILDSFVLEVHAGTAEERYPVLAQLMKEYEEGVLLYRIEQDEIWKKIPVDDTLLRAYYEKVKENYRWPERVQFSEIYVPTDSVAKIVYKKLLHGEVFAEVAKKYSKREEYRESGGEWGLQPIDSGELAKKAAGMKVDSITPPFKYELGWSILKVEAHDSAHVKLFNEVTPEVTSGYQEIATKQREEEWMKSLKTKYPVTEYPEVLSGAFTRKPSGKD
jgi:hypothetical protein